MERETLEHSVAWRALAATRRRLVAALDGSVLVPTGDRLRPLRAATGRSRVTGVLTAPGQWLHASALYRWLARDPDPTAVTIDLRDSRIVGPFLPGLVRMVDRLYATWTGSRFRAALGRLPWGWLRGSSVYSALAAAFAPPPELDGADGEGNGRREPGHE